MSHKLRPVGTQPDGVDATPLSRTAGETSSASASRTNVVTRHMMRARGLSSRAE
jgi:hypothetical protein